MSWRGPQRLAPSPAPLLMGGKLKNAWRRPGGDMPSFTELGRAEQALGPRWPWVMKSGQASPVSDRAVPGQMACISLCPKGCLGLLGTALLLGLRGRQGQGVGGARQALVAGAEQRTARLSALCLLIPGFGSCRSAYQPLEQTSTATISEIPKPRLLPYNGQLLGFWGAGGRSISFSILLLGAPKHPCKGFLWGL